MKDADWLTAPSIFAMGDVFNRGQLLKFLDVLRHTVVIQKRKVRIDFRGTTLMNAAGTLLFAAELDRLNAVVGPGLVSCNYPKDSVVAQVLQHVGIFEMLGQRRTCDITSDRVKYWRIESGSEADGAKALAALKDDATLFSTPEQAALYRGLTEAMTNCRQHAYAGDRGDGLKGDVRKWWLFWQLKDQKLSVTICDLGIGIPRSLREDRGGWLAVVRETLAAMRMSDSDGELIKAAMELRRTRTHQRNRGKGLNDLRAVLDELKGVLHIHSNRGFFKFNSATGEETWHTFTPAMSIRGTLILWQIPLPGRAAA